jgi:hypothetical protein
VTLPGIVNERPQPLNTEEVAAELRLKTYTLRHMCERWEIPAVKLAGRWYIRQQDLDALLAGPTAVTADLPPECEAAVERWVEEAPPLSEKQEDVIAAAFRGAIRWPNQQAGDAP